MKKLLWCSAHTPTSEQLTSLQEMGKLIFLKDVNPPLQEEVNNCPADRGQLLSIARSLNHLAIELDCTIVQLGGSPLFLYIAGAEINGSMSKARIIFAHSERVSIDSPQPDGTVVKTSVFKHIGWI
jgi:hypothetical protein